MIPPDRSRDTRIEDPSNRWLIHRAAAALVAPAVRLGISANAVSFAGLALGICAAAAYWRWADARFAVLGLLLSVAWLIADGLDGMVARATGSASPLGRILDGVCDHIVFILIYVVLATSLGTLEGWALAVGAGAAHIVQSSLFEAERYRFHRRIRGQPRPQKAVARSPIVRGYDALQRSLDRRAARLDRLLEAAPDATLRTRYARAATAPMRALIPLSANTRVAAIFLACLAGDPRLFWWFVLVPLTAVAIVGIVWGRAIEARLAAGSGGPAGNPSPRP